MSKTRSAGLALLSFSFITVSIYLLYSAFSNPPKQEQKISQQVKLTRERLSEIKTKRFLNLAYGYEVEYPKLMFPQELADPGAYLSFVRFEQSKFTTEKGFAIGVSELTLEEQASALKDDLTKDDKGVLTNKDAYKVFDTEGLRLDFEPRDSTEAEPRTIILFRKDNYTYSISVFPEDVELVISRFKFI